MAFIFVRYFLFCIFATSQIASIMKKLVFLFILAPLLMACGSDTPETPSNTKGKILPDQLVRIEAAQGVRTRAAEAEYTEDGE